MSGFLGMMPIAALMGGYRINASGLFDGSGDYLSRTPGSTGDRTRWTLSVWVKRSSLDYDLATIIHAGSADNDFALRFNTDNTLALSWAYSNATICNLVTTGVHADPSAWMHIHVACDTTQATAADRVTLSVNGVEVTSFSAETYPAQNSTSMRFLEAGQLHAIGRYRSLSYYWPGHLSEFVVVDGAALTPATFGATDATTGEWKPKKISGLTYGTNGFYLPDPSTGLDASGNGNDWTVNGSPEQVTDTPTDNYCTFNPLEGASGWTYSNGNLTLYNAGTGQFATRGTLFITEGKWSWRTIVDTDPGSGRLFIGVADATQLPANMWAATGTWGYKNDGNKIVDGVSSAYGATYTTANYIDLFLDMDAGTLIAHKDGVSQGTIATGLNGKTLALCVQKNSGVSSTGQITLDCGQTGYTPFDATYAPLSTANLPAATIPDGDAHFQAVLDTGANIKATAEAVFSGSDYLVWIKDRDNVNNHQLIDTVRGTSAVLQSNSAGAETTYSAPSGNSVAWCWKKGSASGFDILTAAHVNGVSEVVAHSLGVKPKMIILKSRTAAATSWVVWHTGLTSENYWLYLEGTSGQLDWGSNVFNPTATTISIPSAINTGDVVIYVFAEIEGFSRFGSYTGNGSADGPFVHCGFKPAFVMVKRTDSANDWIVCDAARAPENPVGLSNGGVFYPNLSNAEGTGGAVMDINANGFKLRETYARLNAGGGTYIYIAFADAPFGGGKRRAPATAR